jgi:GNAT superfamily N-acetyltransferase
VGDGPTIRPEPADSDTSLALQDEFFADIAGRYPGWHPGIAPTAEPHEVAPPAGAWLVVYSGEEPIGCGGLKRLDDRIAEVKRVFLRPRARGRGAGRALMEALEEEARRLGYERVRLDTGDKQPEALSLFRDLGFHDVPDYNGNPAASYWMEKALAPDA